MTVLVIPKLKKLCFASIFPTSILQYVMCFRPGWMAPYNYLGFDIVSLEGTTPKTYESYTNRVLFVRYGIILAFEVSTATFVFVFSCFITRV